MSLPPILCLLLTCMLFAACLRPHEKRYHIAVVQWNGKKIERDVTAASDSIAYMRGFLTLKMAEALYDAIQKIETLPKPPRLVVTDADGNDVRKNLNPDCIASIEHYVNDITKRARDKTMHTHDSLQHKLDSIQHRIVQIRRRNDSIQKQEAK